MPGMCVVRSKDEAAKEQEMRERDIPLREQNAGVRRDRV